MSKFDVNQFIIESKLSLPEIRKYSWRIDLFLKKLKEGQPFELMDGSQVILKYPNKELEELINSRKSSRGFKIELVNGKMISFDQLKKNSEFGGGRGSGGGASNTKTTESAQCVYCQCIWDNPKTDFNVQELSAAYNKVNVDGNLQDILNMSDVWVNSSILTAQFLHKFMGRRRYKFYRGIGFQSEINDIFNVLNIKEGKPFGNENKWNPADIWMVAEDATQYDFENAQSIQYLNNELRKAYVNRDYMGISLKKVESKRVKIKQVNYKRPFKDPVYSKKTLLGRNNRYWDAKDGYLYYKTGRVQFRTYPTFQCEIIGKSAKHGKVSGGSGSSSIMGIIMYKVGVTPLETQRPLVSLYRNNREQFMNQWYTLYSASGEKDMTFNEFKFAAREKDDNWCVSKYLVTQVFNNISGREQKFLSELIRYAKSESPNSSVHLKIY